MVVNYFFHKITINCFSKFSIFAIVFDKALFICLFYYKFILTQKIFNKYVTQHDLNG